MRQSSLSMSALPASAPAPRPTEPTAELAPAPAAEAPAVDSAPTASPDDDLTQQSGTTSSLSLPEEPVGGTVRTVGSLAEMKEAVEGRVASEPDAHPPEAAGSGPLSRRGKRGASVRRLQERLEALGHSPKGVDGVFGPHTEAAVKAFQAAHGLEADGIVGPKTWAALDIHVGGPKADHAAAAAAPADEAKTSDKLIDMGHGKPKAVRRQGKLIGAKIAPQFDKMVAAAAKDGIKLRIASGYRSYAQQVRLYKLYKAGKGNLAARPGTSNHEKGNAIDFTNLPGAHAWLKRHATHFGFKNFAPEPWHYSLNGR